MPVLRYLLVSLVLTVLSTPLTHAASDYARTRYPIVMVHGLTGAKSFLGVVDYFYGIPQKLKQNGNDQVYVATVSAFAGEDIRVPQLEQFVEEILQQTGATKVNLIGHSQGGYTIRGYAALHPDKVASITSVGTPHHGAPVADLLMRVNQGLDSTLPWVRDALVWAAEAFGWLNGSLNGQDLPQDAMAALYLMNSEGAAEFARNVHGYGLSNTCKGKRDTRASGTVEDADGNQIPWQYPIYSWTGSGSPINPLRSGKDLLDPTAYGMAASRLAVKYLLKGGANDGVVPVCSALMGDVISSRYYWSHMDEVNQILGLTPPSDPRMAFVTHANRLKKQGL